MTAVRPLRRLARYEPISNWLNERLTYRYVTTLSCGEPFSNVLKCLVNVVPDIGNLS
jgi:hypothetical protein